MSPQLSWLPCCLAWLAGIEAHAETIKWFGYCPTGSNNLTSANSPMDGSFRFELGVFINAFVPSASNTAQWAANWVAAQRVTFNAQNKLFTGQFTVTNNSTPFNVGKAAYVWGFQGGTAASEWILFRKSTWTWPAPNPMDPYGLDWDAAAATAVLGSINAGGSPFFIQSAVVTDGASPTTTWQQWQAAELAGESLNGPNDDPDHDGTLNLMEYVFGTLPKQAGAPPATPVDVVTIAGQRYLQITIPRRIDHPATLTVQVSSDLAIWNSGPASTLTVSNSPAALVARDLTPLGADVPQRFIRLKAELVTP